MTVPGQEVALAIGDPDHQVQWSEGALMSHTCHLKALSYSPCDDTWGSRGARSGDETPPPTSLAADDPPILRLL